MIGMTKVLFGVAALPLLCGVALAETPKQSDGAKEPMRLSRQQMDTVVAGFGMTLSATTTNNIKIPDPFNESVCTTSPAACTATPHYIAITTTLLRVDLTDGAGLGGSIIIVP